MSDLLYPLALTESLRVTPINRAVQDAFEDGGTSSRLMWPANYFKRHFALRHSPLTLEEYGVLRGFFTARSGGHDSFWYRDNVNRGGNASVRFAAPIVAQREKMMNLVSVEMAEVAPIRALPELYEVTTAAGARPLVWWDPCRLRYFEHPSSGAQTVVNEEGLYDASERGNTGVWQSGGTTQAPGGILAQWQYWSLNAQQWALISASGFGFGAQSAVTFFAFLRVPNITAPAYVWAFQGAAGGIATSVTGSDKIRILPTPSASQEFAYTPDTWFSVAVTYPSGSDNAAIYKDGALVATGACSARSAPTGLAMGAEPDGTDKIENGIDFRVAHPMLFARECSAAEVKAVHNLFCTHFGLSIVP